MFVDPPTSRISKSTKEEPEEAAAKSTIQSDPRRAALLRRHTRRTPRAPGATPAEFGIASRRKPVNLVGTNLPIMSDTHIYIYIYGYIDI